MKTPKKTITTYKLFRMKGNELYPLFIDKQTPIPLGEWIEAKYIPTKGYAHRAGWHSGMLPIAEHLKKKDGTFAKNRVWAECEVPHDVNWQVFVEKSPSGDLGASVPVGGFYQFKRPFNQGGEWIISGAIKVNRILSWEEVDEIVGKSR